MAIVWRIICENCGYTVERDDIAKVEAKAIGYGHVGEYHADEDEWEFRLQKIAFGKDRQRYAQEDAGIQSGHRRRKDLPPHRKGAGRSEP